MQMKFNGYLRTGASDQVSDVYRRDGFNTHGDVITHLDLETDLDPRNLFADDVPFQEKAISALNAFATQVTERGARIYLSCPSLLASYYTRDQEKIDSLYKRLKPELDFPIISTPSDYTFPLEQMFDTPYHLTRTGRQTRTDRLIQDLQAVL
jgi:hypothetical protein